MDDDQRLIGAMSRRDRSAWASAYDRHVGDVFGVVYHLVGGDRTLAEEISQETWLAAIDRFDRFDPRRGTFRDWLLGIARHLAYRHHRRVTAVNGVPDGPSRTSTPPELIEGIERADAVRAALLCLDEDRRRVVLAKYAEGLSVIEIAGRLGKSAKSVESLLSRARMQLRELLKPYFEIM